MATNTLAAKEKKLYEYLRALSQAALAFSGGVDSALLLAACQRAGAGAIAMIADSPFLPRIELADAIKVAAELGVELERLDYDPLGVPVICANGCERCYHCKRQLLSLLRTRAAALGCQCLLDGANADDAREYRPGMRAAAELGVISPLLACGFSKADVRALARQYGLSVAEKPAAACLASRIAGGEKITAAGLRMVEAAETALRSLGLGNVRVRCHGTLARVELDAAQLAEAAGGLRGKLVACVHRAGFRYVTLDLEGYRTGSTNFQPEK